MASSLKRTLFTMLCGAMAAFLVFSLAGVRDANATHEPANKAGAAGSDIEEIETEEPILSETMRVSSPEDVIISVSAECSILTELTTNNENPAADAFGSVRLHVTIDGIPVPVALDDTLADPGQDDAADDDDQVGEVTFCNRAYGRSVTDEEDPADGIDEESDYIHTRTANAFNWIAFDTGVTYDIDGDNVLLVELWADYDATQTESAVADAYVGSRTMIIEPIRVSNHEQVTPIEGATTPENGNGKPNKP